MKQKRESRLDKYQLYEAAVQSPEVHVDWILSAWADLRRDQAAPELLREDFCGTFAISCEWVKRSKKHRALGLDLDQEPLAWGKKRSAQLLSAEQRRRLIIKRQNVQSLTRPGADIIFAGNFSFFIFHQRGQVLKYFRAARASLGSEGLFLLEMAGGPGMIEPVKERKTVKNPRTGSFQYTWHQKSFDPIQRRAVYGIHFKDARGRKIEDAFVYDWRLWTIPEVRDALEEAGFSKVHVYWEKTEGDEGTGDYVRMTEGDNAYSWIAYIAAEK
jgi:hypothetical protein